MIKRLLLGWLLAVLGCSAWALPPELASRIAAGEGDDRVAALQQALAAGDESLGPFLRALQDGRVRVKGGQVRLGIEAPRDVSIYRQELLPEPPEPPAVAPNGA